MDKNWQNWTKHNLERGCSPEEIHTILLKQKFRPADIKKAMGSKFPKLQQAAQFDASWRNWVAESIAQYSNPIEIRDILLKNHFALEDIKREMGDKFPDIETGQPRETAPLGEHVQLTLEQYEALSNVRIIRVARRIETDQAQIYMLENFMNADECAQLVEISSVRLRPSAVANLGIYNDFRTSSTCDLAYMEHPLVKEIAIRTGRVLGINPTYSEGIQLQRYEVGQYFKPHMDYFEPGGKEYEKYSYGRGNRTWTFMVYLNETPKGGGTEFPELGQTFYPKTGTALIWNNLHPDGTPNPKTIHAGLPIEEGNKVIITDWFRELGKGQMIFD